MDASSRDVTAAPVPLLDINRGNTLLREEILEAIARVCDSGRFLFGPDCQQLEADLAALCQVKHGIGCASGSDALLLALMALDIGAGDEVIVPSFTFFATASAAWRLGVRPVFADIDPVTFNVDPDAVAAAITPRTQAIIPVHLFGQCAALDKLREITERHNLALIEDAAQAIGAAYHGRPAGSWGAINCFSFYPTKNLGGFGDGGMMTTADDELAARLRLFAAHGMNPRYYHSVVGINSRLDTIQAAVLNVKMRYLPQLTIARQINAVRYQRMLTEAGLDQILILPQTAPDCLHVWNQYTVRVPEGRRDAVRRYLADHGVGSEVYYPVPLHRQECFELLGYGAGSLPETERAAREVLSLPIFPELTEAEQVRVVETLRGFYAKSKAHAA